MKRWHVVFGDERGIAVVMALILLVVLTGLVLAFLSVSALEPQISQNLASTSRARFLADAGVEWAFNQLATVPPTFLAAYTSDAQHQYWNSLLATGGNLTGGSIPLPGLTAAAGTFSVTMRNDCGTPCGGTNNDSQMTGCPAAASCLGSALDSAGVPPDDKNGRVIVTATGAVTGAMGIGTATRTITAVVKRLSIDIDAALAFPGTQSDVNFAGSAFTIRGIDTNVDGSNGPKAPVYGISVSPNYPQNETIIDTALALNQQNSVEGKSELDPTTTATNTNTTETTFGDPPLTPEKIAEIVNTLKDSADVTINTSPTNKFSQSNLGDSCAGDFKSNTCWGQFDSSNPTASQPKIVYVKGDPNADYASVSLSGHSTGIGILIIENGRFEISGDFKWVGPIIVTGNNVGIKFWGGGEKEIYGGVIVNEAVDSGQPNLEGDIAGNAEIYYSSQAMGLVSNTLARKYMKIYSWREQ